MKYPTVIVPTEIANVISMYRKRAEQEKRSEGDIIYWILDHIQFGDYKKADEQWLDNNMVELAIAVRTGVYVADDERPYIDPKFLERLKI